MCNNNTHIIICPKVKTLLTSQTFGKVIHAFVTSRFDVTSRFALYNLHQLISELLHPHKSARPLRSRFLGIYKLVGQTKTVVLEHSQLLTQCFETISGSIQTILHCLSLNFTSLIDLYDLMKCFCVLFFVNLYYYFFRIHFLLLLCHVKHFFSTSSGVKVLYK